MNLTRLMALGTLASHGPQHGHQIRRTAEVTNVGEWGGVSVGALYRELKLMAAEGLVTEVRTEQVGRRPARTIYAIADQGYLELAILRERAVRNFHPAADPLGVALTFSGEGEDPEELAGWLEARRDFIKIAVRQISSERERLVAKGHIGPLQAAVMRRGELAMLAELHWHEELEQTLAGLRPATAEAQHALPSPGQLPRAGQPPGAGQPSETGQPTNTGQPANTGQPQSEAVAGPSSRSGTADLEAGLAGPDGTN